ncbi:hypothetical protein CAEBREN_16614 [Caenorhabditis brenneri]|uniref:Fork-head domain-containing protein n=1 Tax=Caenorhabditis brenneri TaxID=135651 RepID=G0P145_CAEBE|nr:hypothetical protein CAEBREN_16614 [Caenorhabditis brenneri]
MEAVTNKCSSEGIDYEKKVADLEQIVETRDGRVCELVNEKVVKIAELEKTLEKYKKQLTDSQDVFDFQKDAYSKLKIKNRQILDDMLKDAHDELKLKNDKIGNYWEMTGNLGTDVFIREKCGKLHRLDMDSTKRPPYSYDAIIAMAIQSSPQERMRLQKIYECISANFSYYNNCPEESRGGVGEQRLERH